MKKLSFVLLILLLGTSLSCSRDAEHEKNNIRKIGMRYREVVNESIKQLYLKIERGIFLIVFPQLDRSKPDLAKLHMALSGFLNYHGDGLKAIDVEINMGNGFKPFITVWIGKNKKNYHNKGLTAWVSKKIQGLQIASQETKISGSGKTWSCKITLYYRISFTLNRLKQIDKNLPSIDAGK